MTMEAKIRPWLLWTLLGVILIGGGFTYWYISDGKGSTTTTTSPTPTLSTAKKSPSVSPSTTADTADWKTYTNNTYGFSFKYPKDWKTTEKEENFNDERKYIIELNLNNYLATNQSYAVEIFNSDKTARQFVDSYYGEIEGGPSNITEENINNTPAVKFFMEKAHIGAPAGWAFILFKNGSTAVSINTTSRTGNSGQSISDFWNTISNDKILNQIASTFQFTK